MKEKKVVVLYRVIQDWRFPVFERLSKVPYINLSVIHGPDFEGSKVVNTKKSGSFKMQELFSIKIKGKNSNGNFYIPFSPFLIFHLIKVNPDVVISEGTSNLFNSLQGFIYSKIFRKKFIWWSLGNIENRVHSGFRKKIDSIINFVETKSDSIISYSTYGRHYFLERGVKKENIFVAVNVVDTEERLSQIKEILERPELMIPKNNLFRLLFVGALIKGKSIETLIESFVILQQNYPNVFELFIIGDGDYRTELEKYASTLGATNINFVGRVIEGVSSYFINSDLFIMPGLGGLAVSDALVHGLPVIASIGDGCEKDLVIDGHNGYIIKEITPEKLANKISDIYKSGELNNLKKNSREVINKYNIHNYVEQILKSINYALVP